MTKLDAINRMLRSIQAPMLVTLDEEDMTYEQEVAIDVFDQTNTFIQGLGWWFNTFKTTLTPDSQNRIAVPSNWLIVEPTDPTYDYVVINGYLYDRENGTFDIDVPEVEVEVINLMEFDDLPRVMQEYITIKATEALQQQIFGTITDPVLPALEQQTYIMVLREQNRVADYNVLKHPQIYNALKRW